MQRGLGGLLVILVHATCVCMIKTSLQFCHTNEPVGPDLAPFGHAFLSPTICTVFAKNVISDSLSLLGLIAVGD